MQIVPTEIRSFAPPTPANDLPATQAAPAPTAPVSAQAGTEVPGRQSEQVLKAAVTDIMKADDNARLDVDKTTNAATFLSGEFGVVVKPGVGGSGPDKIARTFLHQHGTVFGINDHNNELKLVDVKADNLGFKHYRYQQEYRGLPVFGQELIVHASGDKVTAVGGRVTPNIEGGSPSLNNTEAVRHAISALSKTAVTAGAQLKAEGSQQLGWFTTSEGKPVLAYEVVVGAEADQRWQMYVDARTGQVVDQWSLVHSAMNRETVDAQSGKIRKEGDKPTGDEVMDAAHDNAKSVYDYFKDEHGRDSIDDKGMKLKSVVHYGNNYNNAFWNGSHMTYGDGDGKRFIPFALAVDVVGHEMAHGVTERTAGLRYRNQSGALNESWSDVFGNVIEKWEEQRSGKAERDPAWMVGEEIFTPDVDGDGLRSMSNPGSGYDKDPQPGHMKDYVNTGRDNGGVHINSGIPNKAAYEVAQTLGIDKLGKIWFRTLDNYLTKTSEFAEAANFTVQSAIDLYGKGSVEAKAVVKAWDSVGLPPSLAPGING